MEDESPERRNKFTNNHQKPCTSPSALKAEVSCEDRPFKRTSPPKSNGELEVSRGGPRFQCSGPDNTVPPAKILHSGACAPIDSSFCFIDVPNANVRLARETAYGPAFKDCPSHHQSSISGHYSEPMPSGEMQQISHFRAASRDAKASQTLRGRGHGPQSPNEERGARARTPHFFYKMRAFTAPREDFRTSIEILRTTISYCMSIYFYRGSLHHVRKGGR